MGGRYILSIYKRAVDEWGEVPQIAQMFEEMGELMTAISRFYFRKRKDVSKEDIAEEIVDVWVMTRQMIHIFDIEDMVKDMEVLKLEQLERQLDLGKNFKIDVKTKKEYFR
jgi:NTP pyrophosphatase (non-canonical NTP hydrolase)